MKLKVLIQPNAKKNQVIGIHGDSLKVRIKAPPVDGEANTALVKFLSEQLNIPQKQISIIHGLTGKNKLIEIHTEISAEEIIKILISSDEIR